MRFAPASSISPSCPPFSANRRAIRQPVHGVFPYAISTAKSFLQTVFNGARAPSWVVHQRGSLRERMDGAQSYTEKRVFLTFRQRFRSLLQASAATRPLSSYLALDESRCLNQWSCREGQERMAAGCGLLPRARESSSVLPGWDLTGRTHGGGPGATPLGVSLSFAKRISMERRRG